jgi:TonB family protein
MRVGSCLLLIAIVAGGPLCAQTTPSESDPLPPARSVVIWPAPVGGPHQCDVNEYYPVAALQAGFEGSTLLQFDIDREGHVSDVVIVSSSGRQDIDDASVACAKTWLYSPGIKDGVPIQVRKRANVEWQIRVQPEFVAISANAFRCVLSTDVGREELKKAPLHTVVRVHYSNGRVASATIVATSGISDLDQRIADCHLQMPPELTNWIVGERDVPFIGWPPGER